LGKTNSYQKRFKNKLLSLNFEEAERLTDFKEFIEDLASYLKAFEESKVIQPDRTVVRLPSLDAVWLVMTVVDGNLDLFVSKIVSEYKQNPERGLPKSTGYTLLFKATTGEPLAMFDSNFVTALRTSSLAALVAQRLYRGSRGKLTVIGSGLEARYLVKALVSVLNVKSVSVYSRKKENRRRFVESLKEIAVTECVEPEKEVKDSDIVVLATDSETPVINGEWLNEGTHVISIGTLPTRRELDPKTIERASVVVLDTRKALEEAGDMVDALKKGILNKKRVYTALELLRGSFSENISQTDITLYKSVGFALLDCVATNYLYRKAKKAQ
jgi:ornithine cyclodeaminase/alanine dehydrogenase-like protein (mu-crystallin family)